MSIDLKFTLTKWGAGLYVVFVMFFGGVGLIWTTFDWLCGTSVQAWYHVLCFFISMLVVMVYEYWCIRLLDWIADKLDI